MLEFLRTVVIVTVLAVAVWVFAESESLSSRAVNATVTFSVSPSNRESMRARLDESIGTVRLEMRGSRSALDRVERELEGGAIEITPALAGLTGGGRFTLLLDEYIQDLDIVRVENVEVLAVRPRSMSGEVVRLRRLEDVPVVVDLEGLSVVAAPTVNPDTVELRVPAELDDEAARSLFVHARISDRERDRIVPGEPASLSATLELNDAALELGDVQLLSQPSAVVGLTVQSTRVRATVEAVLWTSVPAVQAGRHELVIDPIQSVFDVQVTGPVDAVSRIESRELPVVALVTLDATDLLDSSVSREFRWFVREGAALRALPPGVEIESDNQSVTIEIIQPDDE